MNAGLVLVAIVLAGAAVAVRVAMGRAIREAMPNPPMWVPILFALAMVVWAVLDATGVVHESPSRQVRTYIGGGMCAVALIVLALGVRKKAP
jgi:uncharacterized membrane protein YidH (DUF202 family)